MNTHDNATGYTAEKIKRYLDVMQDDGHAWILAHDSADWFYECLRCGDRVHVLSIEKMNKAIKHHYAYMPLSHRAPWNQAKPCMVVQPTGELVEERRPQHRSCPKSDAPLPDISGLERGPLVAVVGVLE